MFPRTVGSMNICVFLSAADLDERYTRPAREFGELIGKGGHTLVWGGSDSGLMKVVADGVQEAGGRLVGVSVEFLSAVARPGADEMVSPPTSPSASGCCWRRPTPWSSWSAAPAPWTRPPRSWS